MTPTEIISNKIEDFCRGRSIGDYDAFMAAAKESAPELYEWAAVSGIGAKTRTKEAKRRVNIVKYELNRARRIAEGREPEFTTEQFYTKDFEYRYRVIETATGRVVDDNDGYGWEGRAGAAMVAKRRLQDAMRRSPGGEIYEAYRELFLDFLNKQAEKPSREFIIACLGGKTLGPNLWAEMDTLEKALLDAMAEFRNGDSA